MLGIFSELRMKHHQSVVWLLIVLAASVYFMELLVMFFMDMLPPMPKMSVFMLDAALLTTLTFPVFYFLVFRPLVRNIAELQQAKDDLRTVSVAFESKDPILITDADANILRANKMFLKMTGYALEEIIGKNPRILQAERFSDDYYKKMWDQLLRHGSWTGDTRIRNKLGRDIPIGMVITAVRNEQQETTHYVAIYDV